MGLRETLTLKETLEAATLLARLDQIGAFLVPASDVSDFPLGSLLRLTVGGGGAK